MIRGVASVAATGYGKTLQPGLLRLWYSTKHTSGLGSPARRAMCARARPCLALGEAFKRCRGSKDSDLFEDLYKIRLLRRHKGRRCGLALTSRPRRLPFFYEFIFKGSTGDFASVRAPGLSR